MGLQVRRFSGVEEGEEDQEGTFVVHVDPQFVGPRQDGVPRLMRVGEFAEMMGWAGRLFSGAASSETRIGGTGDELEC